MSDQTQNDQSTPSAQPQQGAQSDLPERTLIKIIQGPGGRFFVSHVDNEKLPGYVDDGLPTLEEVQTMLAQQGYAPISGDVAHTLSRLTPSERAAGTPLLFKRAPATVASLAAALAKPKPSEPVVIPDGYAADPRTRTGYRLADIDPDRIYDPRLGPGVRPGTPATPKPAPKAKPADPEEAAQRARRLKNGF